MQLASRKRKEGGTTTGLETHAHHTNLAIVVKYQAFGMDATEPTAVGAAALCPTVLIKKGDRVRAEVDD